MNKMIILAVLLAGGAYVFLYFGGEDSGSVTDVIEAEKSSTVKENLPVLDKTSDIESKVSTTLPKKDVNSSLEMKIEERFPIQTNGSVYIDDNTEPELEEEEPESDSIDENVPDSYPVEDAEVYYVPEEERYPGNLGGPPPSPFGSDPNLDPSDIEVEPPVDSATSGPVSPASP